MRHLSLLVLFVVFTLTSCMRHDSQSIQSVEKSAPARDIVSYMAECNAAKSVEYLNACQTSRTYSVLRVIRFEKSDELTSEQYHEIVTFMEHFDAVMREGAQKMKKECYNSDAVSDSEEACIFDHFLQSYATLYDKSMIMLNKYKGYYR